MPLELLRVERVNASPTRNPRVTSYLITGQTLAEPGSRCLQVETISAWKAALCERAQQTGTYVWVGWKDSRYGKDLVTVELDTSAFQYEDGAHV